VRRRASDRQADDRFFASNVPAMTIPHRPERLRSLTRKTFAVLLATGRDVRADAREPGALNRRWSAPPPTGKPPG
jgi:tryptophanyl-tRNA synthetase